MPMSNVMPPEGLYHGDCLELLPHVPAGSVDMILTDLPYGVTDCAWDKKLPIEPLFKEFRRVLKQGGCMALTATQPFATDLINAGRDIFRYDIIWDKVAPVGFLNANKMPLRRHELVLVFYDRLPTYNPQFGMGRPYSKSSSRKTKPGVYRTITAKTTAKNDGRRYPTSILEIPRETGKGKLFHSTQKPVALFELLIRTYTQPGELVLDACLGSGTTALACVRSGRRYIGIEKERQYIEVTKRRIERLIEESLEAA